MNDRGQYGNQQMSQGPRLGADIDMKSDLASENFLTIGRALLLWVSGALIGGNVTPKDPAKGAAIGAAVGLTTSILLIQSRALEQIARRMTAQ